jgi:hypothetical protein
LVVLDFIHISKTNFDLLLEALQHEDARQGVLAIPVVGLLVYEGYLRGEDNLIAHLRALADKCPKWANTCDSVIRMLERP